jgi:hypothetical protein
VRLVHHLADHRGGFPVTRVSRAERLAMPMGATAIRDLAEAAGGCIRPVQLRRTNNTTGEVDYQLLPCRSTLEDVCPPCAKRAQSLRAEQCRDGWHLDAEPDLTPAPPNETQEYWLTARAAAQARRDKAAVNGEETAELDALLLVLDDELAACGIRGNLATRTNDGRPEGDTGKRRSRSTRRRQDAPELPRRKMTDRTTGQVYAAPDGKTYRPSMFLTLTCDSYGKVAADGTPADAGAYDYQRAARDAIHFPALFDRLVQNLRRYLGYDLQYFAAIEPQKRLAPHAHVAFRGAISRADLRQVIAATYHQVWWPATSIVRYGEGDDLPVWHESSGSYFDPVTGEVLPAWDQALDTIGPQDEPRHVARFGPKFDAQGVLAGSKDAARCVRYLTKYLTKQIAGCHTADTAAQRDHATRLADALRYEPCSPRCANWLRYGFQPKDARPDLIPGLCRGKAHRYENLGYAGRRVLVSRKWSGKTLTDHRADRKAWLMAMLDLPATENDSSGYRWERVTPADPDHMPATQRLMHVLADRTAWNSALAKARRRADQSADPPAVGRTAA